MAGAKAVKNPFPTIFLFHSKSQIKSTKRNCSKNVLIARGGNDKL